VDFAGGGVGDFDCRPATGWHADGF
jgi:hypothetical protein